MKKLLTYCLFFFFFLSISTFGQNEGAINKAQIEEPVIFEEGQITIKLIEGLGEYESQSGMVYFGIHSLDEKVQLFQVDQLKKRYSFNKSKAAGTGLSRIYRLSYSGDFPLSRIISAFNADPNVEYAEGIPLNYFMEVPDDSQYDECQHLPQIQAEEAWDIHKGEDGTEEIIIAIVDTGTDWTHEDLVDNTWQNLGEDADGDGVTIEYIDDEWVLDPDDLDGIDDDGNGKTDDLIGWNYINEDGDPIPIVGNPVFNHGTHCSGIAAGATNNGIGISSISYNVSYMAICAAEVNSVVYGYDGIIYAAENGADIISNSWGGPGFSQANQEVIYYANSLGSIVLGSAGNSNLDQSAYPASYMGVMSVAAVNEIDEKSDFSTFHFAVDISAPGGEGGTGILSTLANNEYDDWNGTSMACPLVAGAIGLLKSYHPTWSNEELMNQVIGTADEIDDINIGYEHLIGSGRVNAYEMLAGELEDPYLKLIEIATYTYDESGNDVNEQGELVTIDMDGRNFMQTYSANDVVATLTTNDPDLTIIDGDAVIDIKADTVFNIIDQFVVQVADDASPHFAELNVHFEADIAIPIGSDIIISILIAPDGFLVYEGEENASGYSGSYIADILDRLGYSYIYTATFPNSLIGFKTAFLSFANLDQNVDQGTQFSEDEYILMQDFLEQGGNMYTESGGMFQGAAYYNYSNLDEMEALFGVESAPAMWVENSIDSLIGVEGSIMEGIVFTESIQEFNWYIDNLSPADGAIIPFYESDFGNVSIMYDGPENIGNKTFYLSYALAELQDHSAMASRNNVLLKVINFFNDSLPEGYALSNFLVDYLPGESPLDATFSDISLSDTLYEITSWNWDFDNDGIIDSEEQNPTWTYTEGGVYDVALIVSNGMVTDTLIREQLIEVNSGYLAYDGEAEGADYSGEYIYNYLLDNGYDARYKTDFPQSLLGYEAVFLSFGNFSSGNTVFTNEMADVVIEYLEDGGYVYLEGGDALGYDQDNDDYLLELFGLASANDGTNANPIDSLFGFEEANAITEEMLYTGNTQESNGWIDRYYINDDGVVAFNEDNYGNVAVQSSIPNGRRTFCFSYALSKLDDGEFPSTKEELMTRLLYFFDLASGVDELSSANPFTISIYPNPTQTGTTIHYILPSNERIKLEIMNSRGQLVSQQMLGMQTQGEHSVYWNAEEMPAGLYYFSLRSEKEMSTGKIILMK